MAGVAMMMAQGVVGCADRQVVPVSSARPNRPLPPLLPPDIAGTPMGLDVVVDLSHNNTVTDFSEMRRQSSILAVIHKASEGGDWTDPRYVGRRMEARDAGLLWGAYHFGTAQYSGADQARAFLAAAQPDTSTLMALDLEPNERRPANTMTLYQAEEFVRTIYETTGRLPLVYTPPSWANGGPLGRSRMTLKGAITPQSILAQCDLWVAHYRSEPQLPRAWEGRGWRLWQYAGDNGMGREPTKPVRGVDRCDRNMFGGDVATLYRYWNSGATGI